MLSFIKSAAVVAAAAYFLGVPAQSVYNIDPDSVPLATRQSWCQSQISSCPLLCLQLPGVTDSTTTANDCDATTLSFDCVCGNGLSPNATEYSQTIPYFECQEYGNQCVTACNGNSPCQSACRDDHPCGAQNPTKANATSSSSTMSSTTLPAGATSTSGGVQYNGLGGSATTTAASSSDTKKSGADSLLMAGQSYSLAVVFAGLFAGFALVM